MRIKTGIAGFGLSGQVFHAPFIHANPGFELTAVVERRTKKAFASYPDVRSVASFGELLEQDVELVVVNTPDATTSIFVAAPSRQVNTSWSKNRS